MNTDKLIQRPFVALLTVCIAFGVIAPLLAAAAHDTWYVDKGHPNAADTLDAGRGTENMPFRTIQAAIDNAAAEDTILVKPGVYDEGGRPAMDGGCTNRITLTKAVDILSTGGASVTHIVGSPDPATGGYGSAAVRCAWLDSSRWKSLKGFTLRDGWTTGVNNDWTHSCGGGVYVKDANNQVDYIFIRECIIENCHGSHGGAGKGGTYIRCLIRNCSAINTCAAIYGARIHTCILTGNGDSGSHNLVKDCVLGNCTIAGNACGIENGTGCYNTLSISNDRYDYLNGQNLYNSLDSAAAGAYAVLAPGLVDCRLVNGTAAIGGGRGDYVLSETSSKNLFEAISKVNKSWVDVDFFGNARNQSGAIDIGAIEGKHAARASGRIYVAGGGLTFDGLAPNPGEWIATETPTQYLVRAELPVGKELAYVSFQADASRRVHADMNGNIGLLPPMAGAYTANVVCASHVYYVSPSGVDAPDHGTSTAPFETLQYAVDAVTDNQPTIIHAAEGDYCKGGKDGSSIYGGSGWIVNRVLINNRNILLRGAGAGKSFITGEADPGTHGNGAGATRAVFGYSNYATVQGFTIRNSYSYGETLNTKQMEGYAICGCTSPNNRGFQLADCEIRDSAGGDRCFMSYLSATRCRFLDNTAVNVNGCNISACLFSGNEPGGVGSAIFGYWSSVWNCTAIGMSGSKLTPERESGKSEPSTYVYQTILDTASQLYKEGAVFEGCLATNLASTTGNPSSGVTMAETCYANVGRNDFRLMFFSPGFTCGSAPAASNYAKDWHLYVSTGLDGKVLSFSDDGSPVVGAFFGRTTYENAVYVRAAKGGLTIANGTVGLNELWGGEAVTITAGDADRPCIGYTVDGVTNHFDLVPSRTFTAEEAVNGIQVVALYAPHWYVDADASVGNDGNRGFTPKSAKRTLKAAMLVEGLKQGDTVHAARGDYDEGVMADLDRQDVGTRVIIPDGITLLADEGRDVTFISGANATNNVDQYGCGDGAVSCVILGRNSVLDGFTLRNGRAKTVTVEKWWDSRASGVASHSRSNNSECRDCIVTNCVCYEDTCYQTALNRCLIVGNRAIQQGAAASWSRLYDCIVDRNIGNYAVVSPDALVGVTIASDNDGKAPLYFAQTAVVMTNCLVLCDVIVNATYARPAPGTYIAGTLTSVDPVDGVVVTDLTSLKIDANYMPVRGANIAMDALNANDALSTIDALGAQRVYNERLDVGAVEYDYRPVFATALGTGRLSVSLASPETAVDETSGVDLKKGSFLIDWRNRTGQAIKHHFVVEVTGSGVLTARYAGKVESYTAASGIKTLEFVSAEELTKLSFEYLPGAQDSGWAHLAGFGQERGLVLVVR